MSSGIGLTNVVIVINFESSVSEIKDHYISSDSLVAYILEPVLVKW